MARVGKLKIAQVAPLWFAIPPKKFGGVERIVYYLTEGLVKRGHNVTLFASGDSKTSAKLIPGWPRALTKEKLYNRPIPWGNPIFPLVNFTNALEMADKFDIIHIHENSTGLSNFFTKLVKTPIVTTVHDPFPDKKAIDRQLSFKKYKNHNYVAISKSHKRGARHMNLHFAATIYNGVDLSVLKFKEKPAGNYFVWLGRSAPNKGAREAIMAARKAKAYLRLAGRIDVNSKVAVQYYEKQMKPYFGKKIRYVGEVNDKEKAQLLGNAKALLMPIKWEEPFGLVMAEAMATGTPVIAFNRGAAPEIVQHGKTGFIVKTVSEMASAMKKIDKIDRKACRKRVEEHFSVERMVEDYEKLYFKLINKK